MQVLSGDDTFGNLLVTFGAPFQDRQRARIDGAHSRASFSCRRRYSTTSSRSTNTPTWQALADEDCQARAREQLVAPRGTADRGVYAWGVPPQDVLDRAVALRKRLDAQVTRDLPAFKDKLKLVVGKARFTPDGYEIGNEGLVYLDAAG